MFDGLIRLHHLAHLVGRSRQCKDGKDWMVQDGDCLDHHAFWGVYCIVPNILRWDTGMTPRRDRL